MAFPSRYPHEGEGSNSVSPRPKGNDLPTALAVLKEQRIALGATDLSEKIKILATKLRADRDEKIHLEAELQVYRSMTDEEFAAMLQHIRARVEERRQAYDGACSEILDAKAALHLAQEHLSNAERRGRTLFTELNRAEASLGWMCERRATANEGVPDEDLVKPTDEEVEAYAMKLVMRAHEE